MKEVIIFFLLLFTCSLCAKSLIFGFAYESPNPTGRIWKAWSNSKNLLFISVVAKLLMAALLCEVCLFEIHLLMHDSEDKRTESYMSQWQQENEKKKTLWRFIRKLSWNLNIKHFVAFDGILADFLKIIIFQYLS